MIKTTQEEFNKMEKAVLSHIVEIFENTFDATQDLRKNGNKYVKAELALTFVAIDSFSRFYELINGEEGLENKKRFIGWLSRFLFTDDNADYKKYKKNLKCNADDIWKLRNSIIHFYGLPKPNGNRVIILASIDDGLRKKLLDGFKVARSIETTIVDPYKLMQALFAGLILHKEYLLVLIKNNPGKYIEGIKRLYEITRNEQAKTVPL